MLVEDPTGDILARIAEDRAELRKALRTWGAVLFRGFDIGGVDGFDAVVRALSGAPLPYSEQSSPRTTIKGQVYTSTDYPPEEEIFLHNENSYQASWPRTLFFHCMEPPHSQGATPLADTRELVDAIDPAVLDEFVTRRWMVVRNFRPGFGVPWQQAFGTDQPSTVDAYCAARGVRTEWLPGDVLRTTAVRDAVHVHPETDQPVWFNHATFFHVTTLAADVRDGLRGLFADADLPTNTYYGDGAAIPDDVTEHLRSVYRTASTRFDYCRDDILVIDNMLTAHGREPFTGPRRIAVAMADPS